jgi:opacity protein-like surface antigen
MQSRLQAVSLFWAILFTAVGHIHAQGPRAGKFELGGAFEWFGGQRIDSRIGDQSGELELDDLFTGGIQFGYNFTDHININTELMGGVADLTFSGDGVSLSDEADFIAWTVNVDYYILPTRLTPYVSAGVGLISLDNEYYDDYWWYVYPRDRELPVSEVNFLWNAGAGLRWDPIEHLFIKLAYRLHGTDLNYGDEYLLMHSVIFTIGFSGP